MYRPLNWVLITSEGRRAEQSLRRPLGRPRRNIKRLDKLGSSTENVQTRPLGLCLLPPPVKPLLSLLILHLRSPRQESDHQRPTPGGPVKLLGQKTEGPSMKGNQPARERFIAGGSSDSEQTMKDLKNASTLGPVQPGGARSPHQPSGNYSTCRISFFLFYF